MAEVQQLPATMKAQFLDAFNTPYECRSVPLPELTSPFDILIKVDAASYCHTDGVLASGQMAPNPPSFPHIGCHEFAGTVVSIPSNVDPAVSLRVGDRVGVPGRSFHPCTTCFECAAGPTAENPDADPPGFSMYCPYSNNNGISGPGGFREYAVVDARQVASIPSGMTAVETSTLMCGGFTIYAALKRCSLKPGQRVGIMGCGGGLGHLGLQFAVAMGYKVLGIDNADGPLSLAKEVAKEATVIDARTEDADQAAQRIGQEDGKKDRGDMGLDAVILLPESQAAFNYGIKLLRNHGKCVVVSFPEKLEVSARDLVFRDISVIGSLVGTNRQLTDMLKFASDYNIKAATRTFPLEKLNDLVTEYHSGKGGKLVIDMSL